MNLQAIKIIFVLLVVLSVSCPLSVSAVEVGDSIPEFSVVTFEDQVISSKDIKGKASLMLVFWATWCPNCKAEIPHINAMFEEFAPQGMRFLGINVGVNDSIVKAKRYAEKYQVKYPLSFDEGSKLTTKFQVRGTPTIIICAFTFSKRNSHIL